jgi:hypothetical protein
MHQKESTQHCYSTIYSTLLLNYLRNTATQLSTQHYSTLLLDYLLINAQNSGVLPKLKNAKYVSKRDIILIRRDLLYVKRDLLYVKRDPCNAAQTAARC